MLNDVHELVPLATSKSAALAPEDTSGDWLLDEGRSARFQIEKTAACATFSYCDGLQCRCIYGYERSPIDGLCHENKLQVVFLILFMVMGALLYITDYVQWSIREKFLPPIPEEDEEVDQTVTYRVRRPEDLDRAHISKRRAADWS
jgi:hypothetical protein